MPTNYIGVFASSTAFATAGNWSPSGPPTTGDAFILDGRMATQGIAGSDQSAVTVTSLTQYTSCPYNVGSAGTMLQIGATAVYLGVSPEDGSSKTPGEAALNFGSVQNTTVVYASASSGTSNLPPILLKGSHASNKCTVLGGTVGWGCETPGSTYTLATANIVGTGATLILESGGTLTTINQDAGSGLVKAAFTTLNQQGGTLKILLAGATTTLNVGGTLQHQGTGTITTLKVNDTGYADFSGTYDAITVTNCTVSGGGRIYDPNKRVTWSNPIVTANGATSKQIDIGNNATIQPA